MANFVNISYSLPLHGGGLGVGVINLWRIGDFCIPKIYFTLPSHI